MTGGLSWPHPPCGQLLPGCLPRRGKGRRALLWPGLFPLCRLTAMLQRQNSLCYKRACGSESEELPLNHMVWG